MVHVACCIGNIVSDFFRVFRENESASRFYFAHSSFDLSAQVASEMSSRLRRPPV